MSPFQYAALGVIAVGALLIIAAVIRNERRDRKHAASWKEYIRHMDGKQ